MSQPTFNRAREMSGERRDLKATTNPVEAHAENPAVASDKGSSGLLENEFLRIEVNSRGSDITGLHNKRTGKQSGISQAAGRRAQM